MFRFISALFTALALFSTSVWATPVLYINDTSSFETVTENLIFSHESFEQTSQQWTERCGDVSPEACSPSNRYAQQLQFGQVNVATEEGEHFRLETAYKNSGDFVSDGLSSISAAPGGYQNWGPVTFSFDFAINAIQFDLLDVATSIGDTVLTFTTNSGYESLLFHLPGSDDNNGRIDSISFYDPVQSFTTFTLNFDCSQATGSSCATDDLVGVDAMRFAAVPEPDLRYLMFAGLLMLPWRTLRYCRNR
ncbi:MAG: hypothetical protein ABW139_07415 [Candidatus Thiodiazotropha sp. DIVDIV]